MKDFEQKAAARQFIADWQGRGDEKQDTQRFWLELLQKVYGVAEATKYITFELPVKIDHTSFIDGFIEETRVLIEQKSLDVDLKKSYRQSDGAVLNPYQQGRRYAGYLPHNLNPRWIIACNFQTFEIHDMNRPNDEPEIVALADLEKEYPRLQFLVDVEDENVKKETEISKKAGDIVGLLYKALLKQYHDPDNPETLKSLNALCVRLVFCFYAEDANIFGRPRMFHNYLNRFSAKDARRALIDLFKVLDTPEKERDEYMEDDLKAFPYVNGGLFSNENIVIPQLNDEIMDLILRQASESFDWSGISPTIFGAVFESTLNPDTRRKGGMHYTSIANINKIIEPLFLNELRAELEEILQLQVERTRRAKLEAFQSKLASLRFLDPACGSGNFLTQSYLSLRRLENIVISELNRGQMVFDVGNPIKVSIEQFYGIEINDFAVTVAKTALWIAESQMLKETAAIVHRSIDFLPLKSYVNIVRNNALQMDWESVVPKNKLSYIMGNPPFVGKKEQNEEQKKELISVYGSGISGVGNMDYVTGWYVKAAEYISGTNIVAAFVSTNSITQGEQPPVLWAKLLQYHVEIKFAYRTFIWANEANDQAHVHCVIIGFTTAHIKGKRHLYQDTHYTEVDSINPYLVDAPTVLITSRSTPLANVPEMCYGSMPIDKNNLILDEQALQEALRENPANMQFIREYVGGEELLNGRKRWCIWLDGVDPALYMNSKFIMGRIEANRRYRLYESTRPQTNKAADTPHLFGEIRQPENGALVIPKVSSEDRRYIPISYVKPGIIINGSALMIPNATLYHFGILSSNVHNAWMRTVCGRMKSDYQYSANIVYNNFPWPTPTEKQVADIERAAQNVLDARALHPNVTLANMYKEKNFLLFGELKRAHDDLNRVVMRAYGIPVKGTTESMCVAELMKMYQKCTSREV